MSQTPKQMVDEIILAAEAGRYAECHVLFKAAIQQASVEALEEAAKILESLFADCNRREGLTAERIHDQRQALRRALAAIRERIERLRKEIER